MHTTFHEYIQPKIKTLRFATGLIDTNIDTELDTLDQLVIGHYLPNCQKKVTLDTDFISLAFPTLVKITMGGADFTIDEIAEYERALMSALVDYMNLLLDEINVYKKK